jgi:hypothetical protein
VNHEIRQALSLFGRVHAAAPATPEAELGRAIFWDERLSLDGKTSCGSCHFARDRGADRRPFSPDARGALTSRHSPTVFNSMGQPSLRWLGDRKSGADQAEGSLTGSMGFGSRDAALEALSKFDYAATFRSAYPQEPEPLNTKNDGRAIAAYQATLTTPAAFDRFLAGDGVSASPSLPGGYFSVATPWLTSSLEELDRALVLQRRGARLECAEIAPSARFRVHLARVEPIAAGSELPDHARCFGSRIALGTRLTSNATPMPSSVSTKRHIAYAHGFAVCSRSTMAQR